MGKKTTTTATFKFTLIIVAVLFVGLIGADAYVAGLPSTDTTKAVADAFGKGIFALVGAFGGLLGGKALK